MWGWIKRKVGGINKTKLAVWLAKWYWNRKKKTDASTPTR